MVHRFIKDRGPVVLAYIADPGDENTPIMWYKAMYSNLTNDLVKCEEDVKMSFFQVKSLLEKNGWVYEGLKSKERLR